MTNGNEEQKKSSEPKQKQTMEQSNSPSMKNHAPTKSTMTIGAVVIAIGALTSSLYTLSLNKQLQAQLANQSNQNNQINRQLDKLEQNEDKTQAQLEAKANMLEEIRSNLQNQFGELNKQVQAAMSQRFYQNQNWLLLKARYYLELAQINAHWSNSVEATISLLQQTDQLLLQLNDPKIFEIRQAVAKDIAELKAAPKMDIAGTLSQLDAAQNSLEDLSIASTLNDMKPTAETPATPENKTSVWRLRWQDSMNVLSKLVVIRRNEEQIKPLISPALEMILKENIRLDLQEAQWAVLNNNQEVYQLVLNQAITTLKKNFNENAANTAALIKKLNELQQIQLTPKRPDVGVSSLPLLNQLIDSKEPAVKPADKEGQGGTSE
ncbi:uroporphyrinogen-III C-methyltransferase [Legionella rowbothamii]|uniref:uroporphyrinogen-III C-methyltransferase n=1 Tax=Legionella rowbothamii TaxID=96229 RepID=UPI0010568A34|nr:uroporphyrinogen-III C-methyltransferase [Legionella rowbothamii]